MASWGPATSHCARIHPSLLDLDLCDPKFFPTGTKIDQYFFARLCQWSISNPLQDDWTEKMDSPNRKSWSAVRWRSTWRLQCVPAVGCVRPAVLRPRPRLGDLVQSEMLKIPPVDVSMFIQNGARVTTIRLQSLPCSLNNRKCPQLSQLPLKLTKKGALKSRNQSW